MNPEPADARTTASAAAAAAAVAEKVGTVAVGAVVFAAYGVITAPTPYLLDSAEFAAASFGLGLAHPPGEALAILWGKLFTLLPFGGVAFRVGLSQAFAGTLAAVLVFRVGVRAAAAIDGRGAVAPMVRVMSAAAMALVFAFAPGAVNVAIRPEVYALQTALCVATLALVLRAFDDNDPRLALLASLLVGLGLANHPLVDGLAALGGMTVGVRFLHDPSRRWRMSALAFAALCAGAAVIVALPVRAAALLAHASATTDTLLWGDPRTAAGLWWVLSAQTFARKAGIVHQAASPIEAPFVLIEELGLAVILLGLFAAYAALRRARSRAMGIALLGTAAGSITAALVGGFDPQNPDIRGYLGPALAAFAVLATVGLTLLLTFLRFPGLRAVVPALLYALALFDARDNLLAASKRQTLAADREAGELLFGLPPRAALFTAHFETAFLMSYQRLVEGRRPDALWAHLGFAAGPGYPARITAADPAMGGFVAAHQTGKFALDVAVGFPSLRPMRFEPNVFLPPAIGRTLVPLARGSWGIAAGVVPTGAALLPLGEAAIAEAARDHQVLGFLGLRAYLDASLACANGFNDVARVRGKELLRLMPRDSQALALVKTCKILRSSE